VEGENGCYSEEDTLRASDENEFYI